MKKTIVVFSVIMIIAITAIGCQKTPESPLIIGKSSDDLIDKASEGLGDESVAEKTSTELGTLIKESKTDTVKITIKRGEEELSFNVKRKTLYNPAVSSKVIEQNEKRVGYIALTKFSDTAYEQFNKELKKLEKKVILVGDGAVLCYNKIKECKWNMKGLCIC